MGYNVSDLLSLAIEAYAHQKPCKIYIPTCDPHDLNGEQFIHSYFETSDPEVSALLRNVKHGYRNFFCKMVLRDALVFQAFGVYFANDDYMDRENKRIQNYTPDKDGTVIIATKRARRSAAETVLGLKPVIKKEKSNDKAADTKKEKETKKPKENVPVQNQSSNDGPVIEIIDPKDSRMDPNYVPADNEPASEPKGNPGVNEDALHMIFEGMIAANES